ncbi:signal transduction histidine kinase [Wenyingzhuangia heitensis]|uniref:histidine kinase n=1 Tax=Wenyingzhuangia heitensis TaxID=1487859 RepID=A0ABX0UB51_9FLAO|nr:HAMP domain-containing sensor histidine kinase [Wenyingzhuangia heitensis]NIJ44796.1 signal transduction histidine kinase [Wenyingzhuangia heitensis]
MKTQTKILIISTSIFLTYILIFSGFIYYSISDYTYTDFYKRLEIRAITMAKIELESHKSVEMVKEIRQEFLEQLPDEKISVIEINKESNLQSKIDFPTSFIQQIKLNERAFYHNENIFYSGIKYLTKGKEYLVIVSAKNEYSIKLVKYLRNLLFVALAFSVLILGMLVFVFSRKIMRPIKKMVSEIKKISTENLNFRLIEPNNNDELKILASAFNDMLNRLETSFETQKNFISNASHELNTPLTSIIGEAEVVLSKERTVNDYIKSLNTILESAGKLSKKTKALLFLAQTGYNGKIQQVSGLRIDELVIDVKTTVAKIYPEAKIHLDFNLLPDNPEDLKVKGNEQLLHLAISNVVMNACKYSDFKKVDVAILVLNKDVVVKIKDNGIGIPREEIQYIYDPFFRASNTSKYGGYGIGLPLTRNVMRMHNGIIIVNSYQDQGTIIELKLPVDQL